MKKRKKEIEAKEREERRGKRARESHSRSLKLKSTLIFYVTSIETIKKKILCEND
jgi:hypothetical protein